MYVEFRHVFNLDGLVLRTEVQFQVLIVEHTLVGLPDGDDLLHSLARRDVYGATVGRIAVHQDFQSHLVGFLLHQEVVTEVETLIGFGQVGEVEGKLTCLSCGHVTQGYLFGAVVGIAVEADAYVGLFHLLGAVAQRVQSRLKIFRCLLALVGVVALPAKDAEDVAPSAG